MLHKGKSIVLFGPRACGKTRNAEKIAAAFGLRNIADDWNSEQDQFRTNTLHICVDWPGKAFPSISFLAACQLAGIPLPRDTAYDWKTHTAELSPREFDRLNLNQPAAERP